MNQIQRRRFLKTLGWGSFFATLTMSVGGFVRFLYPGVLFERPSTFRAGRPGELGLSGNDSAFRILEDWKEEHSVWLVREMDRIFALKARCTHLGCTPNWFAGEGIFKCPCHGSRFRRDGTNFAGPAPRPLDRVGISLDSEGNIIIDKGRVFTYRDFGKKGAYVRVKS